MLIPYVNLKKQYRLEKKKLLKKIDSVLSSGDYILGDEVEIFEKNISKLCKTKYCVALKSGTDALTLSLHLLGVKRGDEVITPPNSFISSTSSITHLGAIPVFVDVKEDQNINENLIEKKITKKTKAIMPVHLTGRMCAMDKICFIGKKYGIPIIEDSAQSIMSKFNDKPSGSWGDIGCFSTHPLKNLNALGDGGFLTTNNISIFEKAKIYRNHGLINRNKVRRFAYLSRMDNLQAAILNFRIKSLENIIKKRRRNVEHYLSKLDLNKVYFPLEKKEEFNTYHTFVIQIDKRDELKKYLYLKGIGTSIHYPIPIHLQPAAKMLGYKKGSFINTERQSKKILTLPINQFLKKKEIFYICKKINEFFK